MNKVWTHEQKQFLIDNVNIYNDKEMANKLSIEFNRNFTFGSVRKFRQRLNIKKVAHRSYFKVQTTNVE